MVPSASADKLASHSEYVLVSYVGDTPAPARVGEYDKPTPAQKEETCNVPHSVQLNIKVIGGEGVNPLLSSIQQDFPGEFVEYTLLDYYGGLGRIQTLRFNHVLYMPMTHITDKTTKECFQEMLEHCEGTQSAQQLVACIERSAPERVSLVRSLMFIGFKAVTFVKHPRLVPKNTKLIFMLYWIYKDKELITIEP